MNMSEPGHGACCLGTRTFNAQRACCIGSKPTTWPALRAYEDRPDASKTPALSIVQGQESNCGAWADIEVSAACLPSLLGCRLGQAICLAATYFPLYIFRAHASTILKEGIGPTHGATSGTTLPKSSTTCSRPYLEAQCLGLDPLLSVASMLHLTSHSN